MVLEDFQSRAQISLCTKYIREVKQIVDVTKVANAIRDVEQIVDVIKRRGYGRGPEDVPQRLRRCDDPFCVRRPMTKDVEHGVSVIFSLLLWECTG